ncbi:MAG: cation-transporting P-type ATPase, partial [Cetobacterium sp.]
MRRFYAESKSEVMGYFNVTEAGLKKLDLEKIREEYGLNSLKSKPKKNGFVIFLEQFKDFLVVILLAAAIISFVSGNKESTIVILAVLIMNAILGTIQHLKAEKSLESLKKMSSPKAKVIRD